MLPLLATIVSLAGQAPVLANDNPDTVVIVGTRVPEDAMMLPMSVDRLDRDAISGGNLQVNLSEVLALVAGVSAQNRQNYAQDLQLSVRGFGARASFGVRGIRLYTDGIPATMPDGQGQVSNFDLGSAGRIEVLRGPFSALYGNSAGGVIALYTEIPPPGTRVDAGLMTGSFGSRRYALKASGHPLGGDALFDWARFSTDGYRQHSAARRDNVNTRWHWALDSATGLSLIGNAVESPDVQDPLGLTRSQLQSDPSQAGSNALAYNTRKSISQEQLGANLTRRLRSGGELSVMAYAGQRRITQFQAIPRSAEANPDHPGGAIVLNRIYRGLDAHWSGSHAEAAGDWRLTAGLSFNGLDEVRRGFLNFTGGMLGVQGDLRRSEANHSYDFDQYLQAQWDSHTRWVALAGLRHSVVDFRSRNFLAAPDSNLSGVRYEACNPVAGLTLRLAPTLSAYASYGRGFETPTANELAYRSTDGSLPGLNLGLRASRSDNYELGLKGSGGTLVSTRLAIFYTRATEELAVQANAAGRPVYENLPETSRAGLELELRAALAPTVRVQTAFTYLDASVEQTYATCTGLPCTQASVAAGNTLPAVARQSWYAGLQWQPLSPRWIVAADLAGRSRIYANDLNTDAANGYLIANLHVDHGFRTVRWQFGESLRIDNLFDRRYAGTVIVNESNARYFEPAPGRSAYFMLRVERRD